jgi:hypothetical protein
LDFRNIFGVNFSPINGLAFQKIRSSSMSLKKNTSTVLVLIGAIFALPIFAQPTPIPTTGDAACAPEPTTAATDTVVSSPNDSGYYSLFDGTLKGWWQSCLTGHSNNSPLGAVFRVGSDNGKPAIYTAQHNSDGNGGLLMTKKKFINYEIVFDFWPDFGNDGGIFNRTTANGKCFQTVLDYIGSASVGGTWGEGGYANRDIRPYKFVGNENTIEFSAGANGWPDITSKLSPTSYGCAAGGCAIADYFRLWDVNGWNEMKIQFYGSSVAGTGNIHMKSWFRKSGSAVWVPILQDTTLPQLTPAGYIGIQVHGGQRYTGAKGSWFKNIMWRPMKDNGEVIINKTTGLQKASKAHFNLSATSTALIGTMDKDFEIAVQDLNGKTLESFTGKAGMVNYAFKSKTHGWLSIQVKTASGVESSRVLRDL